MEYEKALNDKDNQNNILNAKLENLKSDYFLEKIYNNIQ